MQPAGDHAPGVGLHGEHGPEAVAEGLAHQVGTAASLELDDPPSGQAVLQVQLPGAVQGLEPQEAQPHLQGCSPLRALLQTRPGPTPRLARPEDTALSLTLGLPEVSSASSHKFPGE